MDLKKTLRFSEDVLAVLRRMTWGNDGLIGYLPNEQLANYRNVNKALETMGGKWTRSMKCHCFTVDPRPQVEGLLDTGALVVARDGFFPSPSPVVDEMLTILTPYGRFLEPSAGKGDIVKRVHLPLRDIRCIEKDQGRAALLASMGYTVVCEDFLEVAPYAFGFDIDSILMNPPFEQDQDALHVRHAYDFLGSGGYMVSVMGQGVWRRDTRVAREFRDWFAEVRGVTYDLPEKSFKASGTDWATCLVSIGRGR